MKEEINEVLPKLFNKREMFLNSLIDLIISIEPKDLEPEKDNEDIDDIRVISIDADWGYGKTTFKKHLNNELKNKGFTVFTFNAWKNDYEVDAFNSFIREIIPQMMNSVGYNEKNDEVKKKFAQDTILGLNEITKFFTKVDVIRYKEDLKEKKELIEKEDLDISEYYKGSPFEKMQNKFKERLNQIYNKINMVKNDKNDKKIIILIDELDRCRPTFAVELLERVKHLFDTGKYLFIFTVCAKQLQESVRQIYGEAYEEIGYFRRFFDYEFYLPKPDIEQYFKENKILAEKHMTFIESAYSLLKEQNISLRDCEKLNKYLKIIVRILPKDQCLLYENYSYLLFGIVTRFISSNTFKEIFLFRNSSEAFFISNEFNNYEIKIKKSFEFLETTIAFSQEKTKLVDLKYWIKAFIDTIKIPMLVPASEYTHEFYKEFYIRSKNNQLNNENTHYFKIFVDQVDENTVINKTFIDTSKLNQILLFGYNSINY